MRTALARSNFPHHPWRGKYRRLLAFGYPWLARRQRRAQGLSARALRRVRAPGAGSKALARFGAVLATLLLALGYPQDRAALAQQAQATAEAPAEDDPDYADLEEIIVTAPRTLRSMRAEIEEVQNRAFALFNELNVDNDYDIVCRRETPTGSHIPVRVCRPRYVDRLEAEATQDFLAGDAYFDPGGDIMYHDNILRQKIGRMAEENPDFYHALAEFYRVKTAYEEERRERFRDSWFVR